MVELVDTQDLESCEETRTGSIPAIRTKIVKFPPKNWRVLFLAMPYNPISIYYLYNYLLILNIDK